TVQGEGVSVGMPSVFVRLAECNLKCSWCFVPSTPVLLADLSWKAIGELALGDELVGLVRSARHYGHVKLGKATVTRVARRVAPTVIVNEALRCPADHRFWLTGRDAQGRPRVHSGWRAVERACGMRALFTADPVRIDDQAAYERGWLAGMADGDGCFW